MTLEQAKFEISQKIIMLRNLLQHRTIEVLWNEEDQGMSVCFNGWFTTEGFKHEIEYEVYIELENLIHLCYLNELSEEKRNLLVESIIEALSFHSFIQSYNYHSTLHQLNEQQIISLLEFHNLQLSLKSILINYLTSKFLSQIELNNAKIARLVWNGNQLQLAELFLQLELKGWVSPVKNKAAYYRTLGTLFEVKGTEKLESNIADYFTKKKITSHGVFKTLANNDIDASKKTKN